MPWLLGKRDRFLEEPMAQQNKRECVAYGGGGPHFCLGAHLARREISILFEELLARASEIELAGPVEYSIQGIGNPIIASPKRLPVRLKAR